MGSMLDLQSEHHVWLPHLTRGKSNILGAVTWVCRVHCWRTSKSAFFPAKIKAMAKTSYRRHCHPPYEDSQEMLNPGQPHWMTTPLIITISIFDHGIWPFQWPVQGCLKAPLLHGFQRRSPPLLLMASTSSERMPWESEAAKR